MYNKHDPHSIREMFNSIAARYDRTNRFLSLGMNAWWNQSLIKHALQPHPPDILLDLCCGTGAIAFEYLRKTQRPTKVFMLDFSENMLSQARELSKKLDIHQHDISYLQADAQRVPLPEASVNCATMAYGIRNIKDPLKCIQEVFRVLQPGGAFGLLELTQPNNPLLRWGHRLYLKTMIPLFGKMFTSNEEAYQYLRNSIHAFISPAELECIIRSTGFQNIQKHSCFGGVATVLIAHKPEKLHALKS